MILSLPIKILSMLLAIPAFVKASDEEHQLRGASDVGSSFDFESHMDVERRLAVCGTSGFDASGCSVKKCTSNDLRAVGAEIVFPQTCFQCTPCQQTTGTLEIAIDNGTGSTRTTFGYSGTLIETFDPACSSSPPQTCTDRRCADGGAIEPKKITKLGFGSFTFTCGSTLELVNVFEYWSPASANSLCSTYTGCSSVYPKCDPALQTIVINPPLSIRLNGGGCIAGTRNVNIDVSIVGGTAPYTYRWSNGATTQDLTNVLDGVYTLTVTDAKGCTATQTFGPYDCCFFAATCKTLSNPTVQCESAIPNPLTQASVFTADTSTYCGTPTFKFDTGNSFTCANKGTRTYTYTLFDDLDGDGVLDIGEASKVCTQTITVNDNTKPTLSGCPSNANINICTTALPAVATVTATDNCGGGPVTVTPSCCFDGLGVTRTWTASDQCGNQATCTQKIGFSPTCGV